MTRDEANVLFAARDAMWGSGDIHALASLHAEDGIIISPLFGIIKGLPAIETFQPSLGSGAGQEIFSNCPHMVNTGHQIDTFCARPNCMKGW